MAKPILKWVGGKTQLLDNVLGLFPTELENYHEPFLGGGSVLLAFLSEIQEGKRYLSGTVCASDINPVLIALYKHIQTNVEGLIVELKKLEQEFQPLTGTVVNRKATTLMEAKTSQESYYYWIRQQFNNLSDKTTIQASAMMVFLNILQKYMKHL
jgi:DNA adenine methylase